MAPFLTRPGYEALPRPHDHQRRAPYPSPPPSLPGVVAFPPLARVAQRLGLSLAQVDATMGIEDVLDELDLQAYLYDCDSEPQAEPVKGGR